MRRTRFRLVPTTCRRCGAAIFTGNRPIFSSPALKEKWGSICCLTPDELEQMDQDHRRYLFGEGGLAQVVQNIRGWRG